MNKILVCLLLVTLFNLEYAYSSECTKDKLGFYGVDIEVSESVINYQGSVFKSLDKALNSIADMPRDCPLLIIPTKAQNDINLGKALCTKAAELGFKTVSLSDPNHKGWTLFPPGVTCSYL